MRHPCFNVFKRWSRGTQGKQGTIKIESFLVACSTEPFKTMKSPDRGLNPGWPSSSAAAPSTTSGNTSPAHTATADWSNSSWAEMESKIIGHFPIHPLTLKAKQSFIFRLLTPLGEYQEVWLMKVPILSWYLIRSLMWNAKKSLCNFSFWRTCSSRKFLTFWFTISTSVRPKMPGYRLRRSASAALYFVTRNSF